MGQSIVLVQITALIYFSSVALAGSVGQVYGDYTAAPVNNYQPTAYQPMTVSQYPYQPQPQTYPMMSRPVHPYYQNIRGDPAPAFAAICNFTAGPGDVEGFLLLTHSSTSCSSSLRIKGQVTGGMKPLSEGQHGFHVHMFGDFSEGCKSAGPHYNPRHATHGGPNDDVHHRHAGDLGNVFANGEGEINISVRDTQIKISDRCKLNVAGRAIVLHAKQDDLGRGNNEESKKTGNAGDRVGCCLIKMIDPTKLPKVVYE